MELSENLNNARIQSVDILRGAVMIIMAIDHVRVYTGLPAGSHDLGVFLTRWITHYCAPTFTFFAGTSAFLYYQKSGDKRALAHFLMTRGALLVLFEMTIIRFFWTFNFNYTNYMFAGVIWMLGWCMILLAAFVRLRSVTIGIIGLAIIFFQQLFHYVPNLFPSSIQGAVGIIWEFFYPTMSTGAGLTGTSGLKNIFGISILYVLLPWLGVMMAGYGFGQLLLQKPALVKKYCLRIGLAAIILYIGVGTLMILTSSSDDQTPFMFKLLGQEKYPPSQLYLMMTLGPIIALIPFAEKANGWFSNILKLIGRVPMFYYIVHLLIIHLSAEAVNLIMSDTIHQEWYETAPLVAVEENQRWGLPMLYLVWALDIILLYFICKWYARYKSDHAEKSWLKYI
jgi:uncharacterized membrane protein